LRILVVFLVSVLATGCSTSTSRMHEERAAAEQSRAYRIGQQAGTPDNIQAMRSAQKSAQSHRDQAQETDGWSMFEFLFEMIEFIGDRT